MAWGTAFDIINDAGVEVGLNPLLPGTNPWASTDANVVQLAYLLKSCGLDLLRLHEWSHLRREHSFVTVQGQAAYDYPPGFRDMISQTWWNRTSNLPLGGPLSAQEWQYLKTKDLGVVFNVLFRPMQEQIYLFPDTDTPGGYTIAFEYLTSYWAAPTATPTVPSLDAPTTGTDVIFFDPYLMSRKLKLHFLRNKGFDTLSAEREYQQALDQIKGEDSESPILNINRRTIGSPLLGEGNIPLTGFGV